MKKKKTKAPDKEKLSVIFEKIAECERQGNFNENVEATPAQGKIDPRRFDFLNKKISSKVKTALANFVGRNYYNYLFFKKKIIFKNVQGLENLNDFRGGAIVTCNHCHMFDNYAAFLGLRKYFKRRDKKFFRLFKVATEENFFTRGIGGFLIRHCNMLPVSDDLNLLKEFLKNLQILLKRGKKVLIFPEQSMWWYYRKPRPLKKGAFVFAVKCDVPIIPCFLTFKDNDKGLVASDGYPVQEFTLHILPPIYPDKNLSSQENIEMMKNKNAALWKECYEQTYGEKLTSSSESI